MLIDEYLVKMTTEYALQPVDVNIGRSPARKRARYDTDLDDKESEKTWNPYESIDDQGVGRLDYDFDYPPTDDDTIFEKGNPGEVNTACISMSPDTKEKQAAILESVLSKETLNKLSLGEWDNFLIKRNPIEETSPRENYFDRLPDELVLNIMRWMTKKDLGYVSRVCKRFHRLAEDECLWTRMDLSNRTIPPGELGTFIGRQLIILRLARAKIMHPPIYPGSRVSQPDFESRMIYLDLSMADVSEESLIMILSKMKHLRKISLENVTVNKQVMNALSRNKHLEVANLPMVIGLDAAGMEIFLKGCQELRELNIAWTYLNSTCVGVICENLPSTLDRLNFSGCRRCMHDNHVSNLVDRCPKLRELDLSDCTAITGKSLKKIATLKELNFLSLSRCYAVSHRDFMSLKKLQCLQYLDIHGSFINGPELEEIQNTIGNQVTLNKFKFSSIARPTVGLRRSSIWNLRARD